VDILLLPIDASRHVMGYEMAEKVIESVRRKVVIPHHYYIWDLTQRQSTLQVADDWVDSRDHVRLDGPSRVYRHADIASLDAMVHYFGEHVAFDKQKWRAGEYEATNLYP
jgi:L-ascorbate metabolism protein UlaG (beta-lactamase superfamily)